MFTVRQFTITTLIAALAMDIVLAQTITYDKPVDIDLTFLYHVDMDMAEQDVYLERATAPDRVFRATKADRDMNQPVFASAERQEHSPFDVHATGPYPKGRPLGLTLGEWFAAKGVGSYACTDGEATIDIRFEGLVPKATYTMWHFFMASPPTEPFIGTYDLPIGGRDGSDSVFSTDSKGGAHFQRTFKPCLQLSGEHLMGGLAVAWHSDGRTYGVKPGDFGLNSHIQLFLMLPPRAGL
jgi:hypothetical protein